MARGDEMEKLAGTGLLSLAVAALTMAIAFMANPAHAQRITFPAKGVTLTGELRRPSGPGPFPAVVALHGCSGLYGRDNASLSSRHGDWAERLVAAGFAVLFPDSFNPRGYKEICTVKDRPIVPRDRADDALAAAYWLAAQPFVDARQINLLGWSHGAMTILQTIRPGFLPAEPRFRAAIAFYPGCREIAKVEGWRPQVPLTLLIGAADDWTQPGPCRELAGAVGFRFIEYPDAYHDFDAPNTPVRIRSGISSVKSGQVHIGTNPAAREASIKEVMRILAPAK